MINSGFKVLANGTQNVFKVSAFFYTHHQNTSLWYLFFVVYTTLAKLTNFTIGVVSKLIIALKFNHTSAKLANQRVWYPVCLQIKVVAMPMVFCSYLYKKTLHLRGL